MDGSRSRGHGARSGYDVRTGRIRSGPEGDDGVNGDVHTEDDREQDAGNTPKLRWYNLQSVGGVASRLSGKVRRSATSHVPVPNRKGRSHRTWPVPTCVGDSA